jgi:hypothetical protein
MAVDYSELDKVLEMMGAKKDTRPLPKRKRRPKIKIKKITPTKKKSGGSMKTKPKRSPVRKKEMEEYQKYLYDASQANKPVTKPSVMKKGGRVGSHNRLY